MKVQNVDKSRLSKQQKQTPAEKNQRISPDHLMPLGHVLRVLVLTRPAPRFGERAEREAEREGGVTPAENATSRLAGQRRVVG